MNFGDALTLLKAGHKLQREGWNGKGQWLHLIPASHWETTRGLEELDGRPWVGIKTVDDKFMPWVASQSDMLSDDWKIYVPHPLDVVTISEPQVRVMKKAGVWKSKTTRNKIIAKYKKLDAPHGLKKDGTPKKKPGRKSK